MDIGKISFTNEQESFRQTARLVTQQAMEETGASEGEVMAWGLPPTTAAFFDTLKQYVETEEEAGVAVDLDAVEEGWPSLNNPAVDLVKELVFRELLQQGDDGNIYVTPMGRVALNHVFE